MAGRRRRLDVRLRPATLDDLPACERIWRDGLDHYLARVGVPPLPRENPSVGRLHRHTLGADPGRFLVAVGPGADARSEGDGIVGFGSAVERGRVWFLSMLFVDPDAQGLGVGRALLEALLPVATDETILATATDAAQPISGGLYAAHGIVPRMPLVDLVGRPREGTVLPPLPGGISAARLDPGDSGLDDPTTEAAIADLDRAVIGFAHAVDHAFVRREGRSLFLYRDPGGRLVGYGYASAVGRIAPVAVRDAALLAPIVAHLLTAIEPRGASAIWLPGAADEAMTVLLRAGLRFDGFPVLLHWTAPFADFARYVPISPGLL